MSMSSILATFVPSKPQIPRDSACLVTTRERRTARQPQTRTPDRLLDNHCQLTWYPLQPSMIRLHPEALSDIIQPIDFHEAKNLTKPFGGAVCLRGSAEC